MIEIKDIEKLSELSRISLSGEEKTKLLKDIEGILTYIGELSDVPDNLKISDSRNKLRNVMRMDSEPHQSGEYTEKILANAPRVQGSYIVVKKIL